MRPGAKDAEKPRRGRPPTSPASKTILTPETPSSFDETTPSNRSDEFLTDQPSSLAPNQNQNKTATFEDELTQPLTTFDADVSQAGPEPDGYRSPPKADGRFAPPVTKGALVPEPPPSPALRGTPPPFGSDSPSGASDYDSDDEPFYGFRPSIGPPPGFDYNQSQGRPKRNTRKPDRLEYNTFAVRSI